MLELDRLICGHSKKALLPPISRTIEPGKIIFLVGKNGAGKTTLLKTLAGLIEPIDGRVAHDERPIYLPAQLTIADTLTGLDIHEIYGSGRPILPWQLPLHRAFAALSSGEQRQILLNATISHRSPTILLDEPFNFLDLNHSLELIDALTAEAKKGRTIIVATHHLDWIARFRDTETWAFLDTPEKNTRELVTGETKSVLLSDAFQRAFDLHIQILKNPAGDGFALAISKRS